MTNVYYWGFRASTTAFPPDLRVIAGATVGVPTGTSVGTRKVGWMCVKGGTVFASPPDCGTEFLHMIVTFPSCWDGASTDSPDHHCHLAYPVGRTCPADHPVIVPRLVVHVIYDLNDGRGRRALLRHGVGRVAGLHDPRGLLEHVETGEAGATRQHLHQHRPQLRLSLIAPGYLEACSAAPTAAWPAARRAVSTRNGEQLT